MRVHQKARLQLVAHPSPAPDSPITSLLLRSLVVGGLLFHGAFSRCAAALATTQRCCRCTEP